MTIETLDIEKLLSLDDNTFYQLPDNEFGLISALPGHIWKLLYYKEVKEYLDSKKQKKTVTVNV